MVSGVDERWGGSNGLLTKRQMILKKLMTCTHNGATLVEITEELKAKLFELMDDVLTL